MFHVCIFLIELDIVLLQKTWRSQNTSSEIMAASSIFCTVYGKDLFFGASLSRPLLEELHYLTLWCLLHVVSHYVSTTWLLICLVDVDSRKKIVPTMKALATRSRLVEEELLLSWCFNVLCCKYVYLLIHLLMFLFLVHTVRKQTFLQPRNNPT